MRRGPGTLYRKLKSLEYLATRDRAAAIAFLSRRLPGTTAAKRLRLLTRYVAITNAVRGYHTLTEMLEIAGAILAREEPVVLEAGCGYGASTAKLSLAVSCAKGTLIACDSFRGMPENDERHVLLDGRPAVFRAGAFKGRLRSVERTVARWGDLRSCRFEKGLFEDTLPKLEASLDVVVMDVDLIASTKTCLRELWPRLTPDGVVFSLDGQLRATHELLADARFWREAMCEEPPRIDGLGKQKLIAMYKSRSSRPKIWHSD